MSILGLVNDEGDATEGSGGSLYINYKTGPRVFAEKGVEFDIGKARIICDMDSVRTGWINWPEAGGPPEKVFGEAVGDKVASPGKEFKMAFMVEFSLDGERKIWQSSQVGALIGFDALYDAMAGAREGDKLAELKWGGAKEKQIGKGNTSVPEWEIVGWVDRPTELLRDDDLESAGAAASW
jgi:hypothetical protein